MIEPRTKDALPSSLAPIGLPRPTAAAFIGVGVTKFDEMVDDGRMPQPRQIDGKKVWDRGLVEQAFSELPMIEIPAGNPWDED